MHPHIDRMADDRVQRFGHVKVAHDAAGHSRHARAGTAGERRRQRVGNLTDNLARGVVAGNAGDGTARMGRRAALVEGAHRGSIVRIVGHGAHMEELVGGHLAVTLVTAGHAEDSLYIRWQEDLHVDDAFGEAGGERPPLAKPISGLTLGLRLVWRAIVRLFTSRSASARDG